MHHDHACLLRFWRLKSVLLWVMFFSFCLSVLYFVRGVSYSSYSPHGRDGLAG